MSYFLIFYLSKNQKHNLNTSLPPVAGNDGQHRKWGRVRILIKRLTELHFLAEYWSAKHSVEENDWNNTQWWECDDGSVRAASADLFITALSFYKLHSRLNYITATEPGVRHLKECSTEEWKYQRCVKNIVYALKWITFIALLNFILSACFCKVWV